MNKILFTDLDGTIREPLSGGKFISNPSDQQLIPGIERAIAHFMREGNWELIGVTNQAGVAAGHKSLDDCIQEQLRTMDLLPAIKEINFCTDFEGTTAYRVSRAGELVKLPPGENYRKPGAGMLTQYLETYPLYPEYALMIGDREEDRMAAKAAGIDFMWGSIFLKNYDPGKEFLQYKSRSDYYREIGKYLGVRIDTLSELRTHLPPIPGIETKNLRKLDALKLILDHLEKNTSSRLR